MTLGENLRRLRKERGLSQEEVAQALFLTRQSVSKWENDGAEPGVENLKALARLYGVTMDELVGNEKKPEQKAERPDRLFYYQIIAFRAITWLCGVLANWFVSQSLTFQLPLDVIVLAIGIWVRKPAVWLLLVVLEVFSVCRILWMLVWSGNAGVVLVMALPLLVQACMIMILCQKRARSYFGRP